MRGIDYRLGGIVILSMLILAFSVWADEERITLDKLPKAVVDAVKAKFPDAELTGAEKETNGDKVLYEVEFKTKGKNAEMLLTPEGKVVSVEKEIEAKELPKVVANVVEARFPKATVKKAEKETKNDAVTYQVRLETTDKKSAALVLDTAGKVLAQQKEITAKELPKAVAAVVEGKFPKASVKKAEEATQGDATTYTVVLEIADKKTAAIALDAAGKVLGMRKDLAAKELPKAVAEGVADKYPKSIVAKVVENTRGDKVVYLVRLTAADKKAFQLVVDALGKVLKEAEIKEKK